VTALADEVQGGDVPFMIYDTDNLDKGWFCSGLCEAQKVTEKKEIVW
jgi:hypothetical protein